MKLGLLLFLSLLFVGCGHLVKIDTSSKSPGTEQAALESYQEVLSQYVNDKGQVDFSALDKNRENLLNYIGYVELKKINSFKSPSDRLAHLINAYNALSMYMVLEKGIPEDNSGFFTKLGFFYFPEVIVGGKSLSLYDLENEVIRKVGDERVHFALNCMSVSCPRLPKKPFIGSQLEDQLQSAAKEFFSKEENLKVDDEKETVFLSEILDFYEEDFLKGSVKSLKAYAQQWTEKKIPMDYKVDFIDYDWRINDSRRIK